MGYGQSDARGYAGARDGGALAIYREVKRELEAERLAAAARVERKRARRRIVLDFYAQSTGIGSPAPWAMSDRDG